MQIKDILDSLFEYDTCTDNRYIIPKLPYKFGSSTEYIELLVTNGYVKLYTQKGRAYWISQVQYSEHKSPDWKFHFNVAYKDLHKAWNIIVTTILPLKQNYSPHTPVIFGMKVISIKNNNQWSDNMKGREITVYIYKYDPSLNGPDGKGIIYGDDEYFVYKKEEEEPNKFWFDFVVSVEEEFIKEKIEQRYIDHCADGDLWIGKYASLRNEAYTLVKDEYEYPLNDSGWNAVKQTKPFTWIEIYWLRYQCYCLRNKKAHYYSLSFLMLIISIILVIIKLCI